MLNATRTLLARADLLPSMFADVFEEQSVASMSPRSEANGVRIRRVLQKGRALPAGGTRLLWCCVGMWACACEAGMAMRLRRTSEAALVRCCLLPWTCSHTLQRCQQLKEELVTTRFAMLGAF